MNYWLIKSEPFKYSWDHFVEEGKSMWDGVRSYEARNNMMAMKEGDLALFYHSNEGTAIVGIAKISKEGYTDPTTDDGKWTAVDLKPERSLKNPVTLEMIKNDKRLSEMALVRISRLSVQPVTEKEWKIVLSLAGEK